MKDFTVKSNGREMLFHFPTNLDEITKDYLESVTEHIQVADNYCLVAIVYHETLGSVIIARKQSKKGLTGAVVPIFVKAGYTENEFVNSMSCKDKLIIASTQLNLAHHVSCPINTLSLDYFIRAIDGDNELFKRYNNTFGKEPCFFVEFKMVPICDIVGYYEQGLTTMVNPYLDIKSSVTAEA